MQHQENILNFINNDKYNISVVNIPRELEILAQIVKSRTGSEEKCMEYILTIMQSIHESFVIADYERLFKNIIEEIYHMYRVYKVMNLQFERYHKIYVENEKLHTKPLDIIFRSVTPTFTEEDFNQKWVISYRCNTVDDSIYNHIHTINDKSIKILDMKECLKASNDEEYMNTMNAIPGKIRLVLNHIKSSIDSLIILLAKDLEKYNRYVHTTSISYSYICNLFSFSPRIIDHILSISNTPYSILLSTNDLIYKPFEKYIRYDILSTVYEVISETDYDFGSLSTIVEYNISTSTDMFNFACEFFKYKPETLHKILSEDDVSYFKLGYCNKEVNYILLEAAKYGAKNIFKDLFNLRSKQKQLVDIRYSYLEAAVRSNSSEIIDIILDSFSVSELNMREYERCTLYTAIEAHRIELVRKFLKLFREYDLSLSQLSVMSILSPLDGTKRKYSEIYEQYHLNRESLYNYAIKCFNYISAKDIKGIL